MGAGNSEVPRCTDFPLLSSCCLRWRPRRAEDRSDQIETGGDSPTIGHPDMPEFVLQPDEIDAFVAYMESLE